MAAAWSFVRSTSDASARGWLQSMSPVAMHDSLYILAVANDFTRERVETRLRPSIEALLTDYFSRPIRLAIDVDPNLSVDEEDDEPEVSAPQPPVEPGPVNNRSTSPRGAGDRLNPKYSFETFVIGNSNRFAHAAAVAVAEAPGKAYNPLMIYGDSGLGKTHLLHAVGHYIRNYYDRVKVKYVSTEELTNDFINSVSENRTADFRRAYREVDVLLVDDIQFLEGKIQTQEEFFHTFNTLHTAQKQIVLTS
ncbi:MAG TPA: DnaA/Hda family protein, partial [Propionicimonas sp.]|nr:DnaA/Hda family protein [Propionicimonas sp.]